MKALRKRAVWILLALFFLPVLLFGIWFNRQVRQNNLDHALIVAIKKQDTQKAIALLNDGADANAVDKPYNPITLHSILMDFWNTTKGKKPPKDKTVYTSALSLYIYGQWNTDNSELVESLLRHGADPNLSDNMGMSPLSVAALFKLTRILTVLLEYRAKPNSSTASGETPLMLSVRQDGLKNNATQEVSPDCARVLLEHGANINAMDADGQTALMIAEQSSNSLSIIQLLLVHDAKVSIQDKKGKNTLDYIRDYEKAKWGEEIPIVPIKGSTPLLEAALKKEQAQQHPAATAHRPQAGGKADRP